MFQVGDEITLDGVCKGGEIIADAPSDQLQLWRVKRITPERIVLEPLSAPGVLDVYADRYGAYWITRDAAATARPA